MRTRVKICGITRPDDGLNAAMLGADAIGLVFYEKSPRAVDVRIAKEIIAVLPPFVTVVGLFVDPTPQEMAAVLHRVPLDILQFHGNEEPGECSCYNKPYIKAIPMRDGVDLEAQCKRYAGARGLLLDSYDPNLAGGTGKTFNWSLIPKKLNKPIILAGGLTPDNVWKLISSVRPFAVDVSSGVEVAKGIKDPDTMAAFIRGVNNV
ncbi:MAG: phosphoribosylanthranilate isomerase [Gammaproteobacteria bacterium]|nr:phosphoribosylanthranilate isomerase [Gammaproteobacteria bacterium]MDH5800944.1 phosphoribosylanthranilate isomerase [Gammaproteobacteria bacterium]